MDTINLINIFIIVIAAFVIALIITKYEIPILRKKAGQNIREEGLESHYSKAGTPSMGGISIIISVCLTFSVTSLASGCDIAETLLILMTFLGYGLIGLFDDYLKVIKKHSEGFKPEQKFGLQAVIAIAFAIAAAQISDFGTMVYIPLADTFVEFGIWYYVFEIFAVLAVTNAVNLTDGLDGLASGVTAIVALFFAIGGMKFSQQIIQPGTAGSEMRAGFGSAEIFFFAALCGACLGFLVFNKNPARVFMGDTGSLAMGGGLAAAAIVMHLELLLIVAGIIYVIEALSVVLQVSYFKITRGKRIFKMAPIHHHFELCGFSERQVVLSFWLFTLVCCIAAFFMI